MAAPQDDGLPYIVMEYIDGPWITTYVGQRKLGLEARLRLFLEVCSAVDYAHRNFVMRALDDEPARRYESAAQFADDLRRHLESAAFSEPYLERGHASLFVLFMRANQRLALNAVARSRRAEALKFAERARHLQEGAAEANIQK